MSCCSRSAGSVAGKRLERLAPACRVHGDRREQLAQLRRRARVEPAVGALGETRDLAERLLGARVAPFLEQEHRHAQERQLARAPAKIVDVLLHAVADVHQRVDRLLRQLRARVREHLADLRVAPGARDARHQRRERVGVRHPARGSALAGAAEEYELHIEPADRLHGLEHVGLQRQRHVPCRLPAHGGIHREHQPTAPAACARRQLLHAADELRDIAIARASRNWTIARLRGRAARRRRRRCRAPPALVLVFVVGHCSRACACNLEPQHPVAPATLSYQDGASAGPRQHGRRPWPAEQCTISADMVPQIPHFRPRKAQIEPPAEPGR